MSINTMTPADIAAVTGNRDGGMWGGDWSILIILFFLLAIGGWGNNRNDNPYAASAVTQADLQRGFDAQAVGSKLDSLTGTVSTGFANAEVARCNEQMNLLQTLNAISSQQQQCCCDNRASIADLKYTMATEACAERVTTNNGVRDIIESQTAGFQAILDKMCQAEIDNLKTRNAELLAANNSLQGQISQTAQNAFFANALNAQTAILNPTPIPAYVVQNPNCCGTTTTCGG